MLAFTQKFCADVNNTEPYWLTICGDSGIGKTKLARAAYEHFMAHSRFNIDFDASRQRTFGNTGQYCDWRKLCSDLRGGSFGRIDDLCEDWFVILDDIGTEHDPNGFIASALDRIANERMRSGVPQFPMGAKWTLITCNMSLSDIASKLDARIASRMQRGNNIVLEIKTTDYALRV